MKESDIKSFVLLLLSTILLAQPYPYFTHKELKQLQKISPIAANRILDYKRTLSRYKKLSKIEQLKRINFYCNNYLPGYDAIIDKTDDYWETPKEFLKTGYGDCEDYAIIKYYSLINLGFKKKKLFLTVVKENASRNYHMVLSYFQKPHHSPMILDNLSFKILPLSKRIDLQAVFFINAFGVYKMSKNMQLIKIANRYKNFTKLEQKVASNQ